MAVVSVTDSNNQVTDAESVTNWTKIGGASAPGILVDFVYQGTYSVACQVSSETAGEQYAAASPVDMTAAADNTVLFKTFVTTAGLIDGSVQPLTVRIGSSSSDYYEFYVADNGTQGDIDYPPTTSWLVLPINPNVNAWRDAIAGTPSLSAVDYWGVEVEISAASKSDNVAVDAIDISPGLYLVGGTSTDPDGTWQDFIDDDEGTSTNRFGHVATIGGVLYCAGTFAIGQDSTATSTETDFDDSGRLIIFPGGRVDAGWNRILIDCATANTTVIFGSTVFQGRGRTDRTHFFSTIADVDATNDELDITGHGLQTGDAVIYTDEGGSDNIGLTDTARYFVRRVTADSIALYAEGATVGRQNSYSDTSRVDLSAGSGGENHKLVREPDTRPDLTVTGTASGATFDATSCTFDGFREITLTTAATLDSCRIVNAGGLTPAGATIDGCTFQDAVLEEGEALISCTGAQVENITYCTFASEGRGHAIELTSATGSPFDFTGNAFTNYGQNRTQFHTTNDVDGTNDELDITSHGWSDGDHVYYNKEGGSAGIGLTDGAKYYVNSIDANTLSLHVSKSDAQTDARRVDLTASGSETHSLYSGTAAVYNSSGGAITLNVLGSGVTPPTIRNSPGSSTDASISVTLTIHVVDEDNEDLVGIRCSIYNASTHAELMNEDSTTGGLAQQGYTYVSPVNIYWRVRESPAAGNRYKPESGVGQITGDGFNVTVVLEEEPLA